MPRRTQHTAFGVCREIEMGNCVRNGKIKHKTRIPAVEEVLQPVDQRLEGWPLHRIGLPAVQHDLVDA